jgi:quinoprotein glucose dehydrogenase
VRFQVLQSLARIGIAGLANPEEAGGLYASLLQLLAQNNDQDAYIRNAAAHALASITEQPSQLIDGWKRAGAKFDTPAVRLGLVLALRELGCRRLGEFLSDTDPRVVAEAARAIYDQELMTPMPELANLADKPGLPDAVAYRALAANFKLGKPENAARLANFAARTSETGYLREMAMKLLAEWAKPSRRDPIVGVTQSLPERPVQDAVAAIRPVLHKLFVGPEAVRKQAVQVTAKLGIQDVGPLMAGIVSDAKQPASMRVDALFALEAVKAKQLADATTAALSSTEPKLRAAARVVKAKADPAAAMRELPALLKDDRASLVEKQMALEVMGTLRESKEIDAALLDWLDKYLVGQVPAGLKLDVLDAAQARANAKKLKLHAPLRERLREIDRAARAAEAKDPLARFRAELDGGDAERGRGIVVNNSALSCQRCHKIDGQGGEVGPPLNGVAAKNNRDYLLESIVHPSAKIAEGYQSVILNTIDGKTLTGVLRAKTAKGYTIVTADNKVVTVPKDDVESEKPDKSAMPDDLVKKMSKRELRDIVAFLATLKEPAKK